MEEITTSNKRRKVLKAMGGSIAGVSFFGNSITASAQEADTEIDPDFDPEQKEEVIAFCNQLNNLDESEKDHIWGELDHDQIMAYHNANRLSRANLSGANLLNTASIQSFPWDHTATFQFDLYGLGGFGGVKVFELYHKIMWDTDGGEIVDGDSNGWSENLSWFWSDEGNKKDVLELTTDAFGNPLMKTIRKRKMAYIGGPRGTFTEYPETVLTGDDEGDASVFECYGDGLEIENVDGVIVCGSRS